MPIETRRNSAISRRTEQLKRWEQSETNNIPPTDKKRKVRFSDGCVFLSACAAGDTEEAQRLLASGTDVNAENVDGLTALHQACIDNNLEMVEFFVNRHCDVNRGDSEGWTPLHAAASCGFLSIAKFLIEHGANVAAANNDGDLPIDITESSEMEEYLSGVIDEKGIDCNEARSAEEKIMMEDAKLILAHSIDVKETIHSRTGATALHVAASKGYCEVMKILVQANVDINAQDNDGWTPLHAAAYRSQKYACTILAENLANMDIQNFAGQTCFDVADNGMITLLGHLKMKQASMQKARPEIKEILQRTSSKPPLRKQTSVTHMYEKSKSVMKASTSESAQISSMSSPETDTEKKLNERIFFINKSPAKSSSQEPLAKSSPCVRPRTPTWKEVAGCGYEDKAGLEVKVMLKRPTKFDDHAKVKEEDAVKMETRPNILLARRKESELQRKAHAKLVREIRRPTQCVLLEDIKSAKLKIFLSAQQEAAISQAQNEPPLDGIRNSENFSSVRNRFVKTKEESSDDAFKDNEGHSSQSKKQRELSDAGRSPSSPEPENEPSVRIVLRPKNACSSSEKSPSVNKPSFSTQSACHSDCPQHGSGYPVLIPDFASDHSSQEEVHVSNSKKKEYKKLYEEEMKENGKLKEALRQKEEELEKTKKALKSLYEGNVIKISASETELRRLERKNSESEAARKMLERKNSASEGEKRNLKLKISELEDKSKQIEKLRDDNGRLKEETAALIRVISKISLQLEVT